MPVVLTDKEFPSWTLNIEQGTNLSWFLFHSLADTDLNETNTAKLPILFKSSQDSLLQKIVITFCACLRSYDVVCRVVGVIEVTINHEILLS